VRERNSAERIDEGGHQGAGASAGDENGCASIGREGGRERGREGAREPGSQGGREGCKG